MENGGHRDRLRIVAGIPSIRDRSDCARCTNAGNPLNSDAMELLVTDGRARDWFAALKLSSCEAITSWFAPEPPLTTAVIVMPRTVNGREVYFKLYEYASPSWRFW